MTIHFAAARPAISRIVAGHYAVRHSLRAANDNAPARRDPELLRAALRHFARHGIGAAEEAHREAKRAFFAGDRAEYDRWRLICKTLDHRLAAKLSGGEAAR